MKSLYQRFEGRGRDSLLHRNLRVCTEEGVLATPWAILVVPGNVFIANLLTSVMGIGESMYGWIVSLPAWANALQILLVPVLARRMSAWTMTIYAALINWGFWILLVVSLRRMPIEDPDATGRLMLVYFALISLSQSIHGVSWMSWVQEWIPARLRGKYFGKRNRIIGLMTVTFLISVEHVFHKYGESMLAFEIILGLSVALRLLSVYLLTHIYTPWSRPEKMIHEGASSRFSVLLKNRPFRNYLIYAAIQAFLFSLTGPFAPVFMSEYLDFSVSHQTHLLLLGTLGSAIAIPVWGRQFDRHGCRPIIILTGSAWMLGNYLWAILTPSLTWVLYFMFFWGGLFSGGILLGGFNLVLKLTPPSLKSSGISLHLAFTSIAAAFAPILAGWILSTGWSFLPDGFLRYRILFLIQPSLVILSFLILSRVDEPKASGLTSFNGAFRTMRLVLIQNGILLAANISLFRIIRKGVTSVFENNKAGNKDAPGP